MLVNTLAEMDDALGAIDAASSLDEMRLILGSRTQRFGFENFAYWLLCPADGPRVPFFLGSYPTEWVQHYTAHNFKNSDIIANHCATSLRPFLWDEIKRRYKLSNAQSQVFNEGREVGLKAGGSIPVHGPRETMAAFSVSNNDTGIKFDRLFQAHRHELQLIATYAHEKILQLRLPSKAAQNATLTARELEVLTWTAKGKTRWEIGELLHISEETVKKHLLNASTRLQACNKTHAVAVALRHRIILP